MHNLEYRHIGHTFPGTGALVLELSLEIFQAEVPLGSWDAFTVLFAYRLLAESDCCAQEPRLRGISILK
jgi:hypothetical protein